jgi:hypothetical protein
MKKRLSRAYFGIPVVYVGVIVLLLFLQFAGTQRFTLRNGPLVLNGTRSNAPQDENSLREVVVEYRGLEFPFTEQRSLAVQDTPSEAGAEAGQHERLMPRSIQEIDEGFTVTFDNGMQLAFLLREDIQELQIRSITPDGVLPEDDVDRRFIIPFGAAPDATVTEAERPALASVETAEGVFFLAAPPRGGVDPNAGELILEAVAGEQTARYTPAVTPREQAVVEWFSDGEFSISDGRYASRIESYISAAYQGWRSQRFNPGSGTWDVRGGSPVFDERILTAVLAEAWDRGQYTAAFTDMRRAADLHPEGVGLLSSPFLGDLRAVRTKFLEEDRRRTAELLDLARRRDPDLFNRPDLVQFAVDRGTSQLYREIINFVSGLDYRSLDVFQAIGLLHNAVLSPLPNQESREVFAEAESILEDEIVPRIVRVEERFYLESSPGQVDLAASIHAGVIAEQLGLERDDDVLVRLGRNLVVSALAFTDGTGFLPTTLYLGDGQLQGTAGSSGPEEIYRLLSDNPWYPRQVSLFNELGRDRWIYTIAGIEDVSISASAYRFTISYPANRTHYVIMQGLRPFNSMVLFGQRWRNDPSFERYVKGRHYNSASQTLMIKYNDDSTEGDIVLRY